MKKYLLILITAISFAQAPSRFSNVQITGNTVDNSAQWVNVQTDSGIIKKILKSSLVPQQFTNIVYVNATSPSGATIFDLNNPPVTNDNLLKATATNLYIGTDGSTWNFNTVSGNYTTYSVPKSSNFNLAGTSIDAGNNKTSAIVRSGTIESSGFKKTSGTATQSLQADGSVYDLNLKANNSDKGIANGIASLDTNGKVPLSQVNDALLGAVNYKGVYNASTNSPSLPSATTNKGNYWIVSTAGTQFSLNLSIGDWIISNGVVYGKVDNNNNVTSVAGKVGAVTLVKADVGLSNVDNTTDLLKPISTATQTALDLKQNILTNPISGTGTSGYLPKFTSSGIIGNSVLQEANGKDIGLNTIPFNAGLNTSFYSANGIIASGYQTLVNGSESCRFGANTNQSFLFETRNVGLIFGTNSIVRGGFRATGEFYSETATASTIASFDASKNVVSLPTASYPSLAEIATVKGASSNLQNQIDAKATDSNVMHLTGDETLSGQKSFYNLGTGNATVIQANNNSTIPSASAVNMTSTTGSNSTLLQLNLQSALGGKGFYIINSNLSTIVPIVIDNNGTNTFTVDKFGTITANKLNLQTASNSAVGNATLVAGTKTITTTAATTSSIIMLTKKTNGGTIGTTTYTTASGSFTITSSSATDTSTYSYLIIN